MQGIIVRGFQKAQTAVMSVSKPTVLVFPESKYGLIHEEAA